MTLIFNELEQLANKYGYVYRTRYKYHELYNSRGVLCLRLSLVPKTVTLTAPILTPELSELYTLAQSAMSQYEPPQLRYYLKTANPFFDEYLYWCFTSGQFHTTEDIEVMTGDVQTLFSRAEIKALNLSIPQQRYLRLAHSTLDITYSL